MSLSFGARLRQQREGSRVALETIAEQTKIKQALLEGLERDDVSRWPGGIFRRAYIRAYAQAIGLDPDVAVREFVHLYPDPTQTEIPEPGPEAGDRDQSARPPMRLRYVVESAIGSLSRRGSGARPPGGTADPPPPTPARAPLEPDLSAAATLCTEYATLASTDELAPLLGRTAGVLGASGLIVWAWDPTVARLKPVVAHGYSDKVLAHVPALESDADNATAAAFRLVRPCIVEGREGESGALVVPLMTAAGCPGVLAIELTSGGERLASVRALTIIFAAQIARWFERGRVEDADRRLA
jgi:hypothetical protein